MAKITLHVTPQDAAELTAITAALAPFVSAGAPAAIGQPAPAADEAPKPKRRSPRKPKTEEPKPKTEEPKPKTEEPEPKTEEPAPVPPSEPAPSTEQTSSGALGSREALLDAMRTALKAGKRTEVAQVLKEFGAARATELRDEYVAAATAMVVAL